MNFFKQNIFRVSFTLLVMTLFILCLMTLQGCGKSVRDFGPFEAYVTRFETYSQQYSNDPIFVDHLIVRFGSLKPSILGDCTRGKGTPTITINQFTWDSLSEHEREILLFHEMGHCVQNRPHRNEPLKGGRKWASIMIAWPQHLTDYEANKEGYLQELFDY